MSRNDFRRRQAQRQRRKLVRHLPIILALFLAFSALASGVFALTRFVLNRQPISSVSASFSTAKTASEDPAQPVSSPASGTLAQAAYIAAGYDYDRAIALIKEDSSLAEDPAALEADDMLYHGRQHIKFIHSHIREIVPYKFNEILHSRSHGIFQYRSSDAAVGIIVILCCRIFITVYWKLECRNIIF